VQVAVTDGDDVEEHEAAHLAVVQGLQFHRILGNFLVVPARDRKRQAADYKARKQLDNHAVGEQVRKLRTHHAHLLRLHVHHVGGGRLGSVNGFLG